MAYRKLGRTNKHRKAMLANLTKDLIKNVLKQLRQELKKFANVLIKWLRMVKMVA